MESLRVPIADETGDTVRLRFEEFLKNYHIPTNTEEIIPET